MPPEMPGGRQKRSGVLRNSLLHFLLIGIFRGIIYSRRNEFSNTETRKLQDLCLSVFPSFRIAHFVLNTFFVPGLDKT